MPLRGNYQRSVRLNGRTTYLRGNALRFACNPDRPEQPFHIIYAAGLFDYLNEMQAYQLIEDCHGLLAPGGRLIIGNFSVDLPANKRVLIEWLLEWPLLYRDEADYRHIFISLRAHRSIRTDCASNMSRCGGICSR